MARRVASVAAMFVLGLSLLLPTLSHSRNEANRLACAANLGFMGQGLSRYTADNAGFFPRLTHDPIESPTAIEPGLQPRVALPKPNPNSANLFLIIRHRYVRSDQAVCPGLGMTKVQANADGTDFKSIQAVPFSYQNQVTAPALRITIVDPRRAVIADRNPLFIVQQGRNVAKKQKAHERATDVRDSKRQALERALAALPAPPRDPRSLAWRRVVAGALAKHLDETMLHDLRTSVSPLAKAEELRRIRERLALLFDALHACQADVTPDPELVTRYATALAVSAKVDSPLVERLSRTLPRAKQVQLALNQLLQLFVLRKN